MRSPVTGFLRSRVLATCIAGAMVLLVCKGTPALASTPQTPTTPAPVTGSYADAISAIGAAHYSTTYAGSQMNADGSVTVYVGPGSDSALVTAVSGIPTAGLDDTPANVRANVTFVRVPHNLATLNGAQNALTNAGGSLAAKGYELATWYSDASTGTVQAYFTNVPAGTTPAAATAQLDATVAPEISVASVNAPPVMETSDRQADASPWKGSDRLIGQSFGNGCTAGFAVVYPGFNYQMLTAAHCSDQGYLNNGNLLGSTSSYLLDHGAGEDIQNLNAPYAQTYAGDVWIGEGTNQPTEMRVGGPFANRPTNGQPLTFDGSYSKTHRYIVVQNNNACTHFQEDPPNVMFCGLLMFHNQDSNGNLVDQPGDSGGPVFCFACYPNVVTPAGIIEGADGSTYAYATWIGSDLAQLGGELIVGG